MRCLVRCLIYLSTAAFGTGLAGAQCALCRNAFLYSQEAQAMAAGFNRGILFLLAVPFLTTVALVVAIRIASRRS